MDLYCARGFSHYPGPNPTGLGIIIVYPNKGLTRHGWLIKISLYLFNSSIANYGLQIISKSSIVNLVINSYNTYL